MLQYAPEILKTFPIGYILRFRLRSFPDVNEHLPYGWIPLDGRILSQKDDREAYLNLLDLYKVGKIGLYYVDPSSSNILFSNTTDPFSQSVMIIKTKEAKND